MVTADKLRLTSNRTDSRSLTVSQRIQYVKQNPSVFFTKRNPQDCLTIHFAALEILHLCQYILCCILYVFEHLQAIRIFSFTLYVFPTLHYYLLQAKIQFSLVWSVTAVVKLYHILTAPCLTIH